MLSKISAAFSLLLGIISGVIICVLLFQLPGEIKSFSKEPEDVYLVLFFLFFLVSCSVCLLWTAKVLFQESMRLREFQFLLVSSLFLTLILVGLSIISVYFFNSGTIEELILVVPFLFCLFVNIFSLLKLKKIRSLGKNQSDQVKLGRESQKMLK